MNTIQVYSANELKDKFPDAFEKALEKYQNSQDEIFWSDEIVDSLKSTFETAGINLINWSIGSYSQSWVRFEMPDDEEDYINPVEDYTGQKAYNWIKKNVLDGAKFKRVTYNKAKGGKGWRYDITKQNGDAWSCEFTGYCADHDYIESLLDDIKGNCTLSDAFHNLADVASRLLEQEEEYQKSEEYFIEESDINDYQFTKDGIKVS